MRARECGTMQTDSLLCGATAWYVEFAWNMYADRQRVMRVIRKPGIGVHPDVRYIYRKHTKQTNTQKHAHNAESLMQDHLLADSGFVFELQNTNQNLNNVPAMRVAKSLGVPQKKTKLANAAMAARTRRPLNVWVSWPTLKARFGKDEAKDLRVLFCRPKSKSNYGLRMFLIPYSLWRPVERVGDSRESTIDR